MLWKHVRHEKKSKLNELSGRFFRSFFESSFQGNWLIIWCEKFDTAKSSAHHAGNRKSHEKREIKNRIVAAFYGGH